MIREKFGFRALDGGRRLLGRDAGAGLCAGASRTASRASCCARPSSAPAPNWRAHFSTCCRGSIPVSAMISSSVLPPEERAQPLDAYWRRILDPDPAVHGPAARAWDDTERILSEHTPGRTRLDPAALNSTRALPASPFMEAHYFQNDCFMKPNQLMAEAGKLGEHSRHHRARPLRSVVSAGDFACAWRGLAGLGNSLCRRRRPFAVRSRRQGRRDEGDCGYGFQNHRIRNRRQCRSPEKACC